MTRFKYDEEIPVGYYDVVFQRRQGIQSMWHHLKFLEVRRMLGSPKSIVDFGCGPGTFVSMLGQEIYAYGVDTSPHQIEYARKRYGTDKHHFAVTRDGTLPVDDESVEAVSCIEVIEHLHADEYDVMLDEAVRVLQPGGQLVVTTPNYRSLWPILELFVNRRSATSYEEQHVSKFTPRSLYSTISGHGLEIQELSTILFLAPFAAALSWKLAQVIHNVEKRIPCLKLRFLILLKARKPTKDLP